jgi:AAA domain
MPINDHGFFSRGERSSAPWPSDHRLPGNIPRTFHHVIPYRDLIDTWQGLRKGLRPEERGPFFWAGENGVGKSALAGRWLRSLEPKLYCPVCITQASLTGIGLLGLFLQKLGKGPNHQRSASLKLLEEAFGELGRLIPVLLLDEAQNYASSALEEVRMLWDLTFPTNQPSH